MNAGGSGKAETEGLPILPPGFRLITLREKDDAFALAMSRGAEAGAGALFWTRRFDHLELALVLEPEEPLETARRALYIGMNALADALAAHCPPEKPLEFDWPDQMTFDRGLIGGGRLGWPRGARENLPPDFLVFGGMLRSVVMGGLDGRSLMQRTSLETEGFEFIDHAMLIESFAKNFLVQVDEIQEKGFKPIGQRYLARLPQEKGIRRGIDANGDLLIHALPVKSPAKRQPLLPVLASPRWLDADTGQVLI